MKKFNASDLSKRPKEVWEAARNEGALIQHKDRSGGVTEEFVIAVKYSHKSKEETHFNSKLLFIVD